MTGPGSAISVATTQQPAQHRSVRSRRAGAVVAVAVLGSVLAACVPPPAPALPACPARTDVVLEAPDPVDFSLPRAASPDGAWVALSRVVGDDVVFSARRTDAGAPTETVGSVPYADLLADPPRVSIAAGGDRVVFAGNRYATTADGTPSPVLRWVRATGTTAAVAPPTAASPPPGIPYPVNLRALSADGSRAVWSQAFYQGAGAFRFVRTVTDTGTDAVLSQREFDPSPGSQLSTGGRSETLTFVAAGADYAVVDVDTGSSTSLAPALAAAQAAHPGGEFRPVISSDDGRFTVLQRPFETPATYLLWDHADQQVSLVAQGPGIRIDTVDDAGTVVHSVDTGPTIRSVHRSVDGTELTVADAPMQPTWPGAEVPVVPLTSADQRTSVYSEVVPVLGNRLVARRCR